MIKRRLISATLAYALTAYAAALIIFSEQTVSDMQTALARCINVMIPSLFAFMAISDLMIRSGAYIFISKLLTPLAWITGLPKQAMFPLLMGNIGGYPVGTAVICTMLDNGRIDKKSAARLTGFCYNGGPAFFSGAVGLAVFGSAKVGLMIFAAMIAGNLLSAAILSRIFKIHCEARGKKFKLSGEMLAESVDTAGRGLFKICCMILFFQTAITILRCSGAMNAISDNELRTLAYSLLEISNLSAMDGLPYRLLPLIAASGALGGLCVMMQIKTIIGGRFNMLPFLGTRCISAAFAGIFCMIFSKIFGENYIAAASRPVFIVNFNNFIPVVCLIMMIFLTVLKKRLAFSE